MPFKTVEEWAEWTKEDHIKRGYDLSNIKTSFLIELNESHIGEPCIYCGRKMNLDNPKLYKPTLDIVNPKLPVNEGNLQIICKQCNSLKKQMSHIQFKIFMQTGKYADESFTGKTPENIKGFSFKGRAY